jgi:hypothetical protein
MIVKAPLLVLPSLEARVKLLPLLVYDDQKTINVSPLASPNKLPAFTLNAPPMLVPKPTEIAMLMPEPDADKPLLISTVPLSTTLAVPVFNNESPNTPAIPALLIDTAMLPELVAMPTPDEVVMELPKAILSLLLSIVTAPPLVLPSPKARVKLPPLMVNDNPEMIDTSPPAAPDESPAITLNAPLMLALEPAEIAMLPSEPDADKPLPTPKAPLLPTLKVPVFINRSPNTLAVPALLVDTAMLPKLVALPRSCPRPYYHCCHQLSQLLLLCCHLPRPESSSRPCWSMTIQKQLMHLLWLLQTSPQPSH